jgi:hypothetical protein
LIRTQLNYVPIVDDKWVPDGKQYKHLMYHPQSSTLFSDNDKDNILSFLSYTETLYVDLRQTRVDESEISFYSLFDAKESNTSGIENYIASLAEIDRHKIVLIGASKKIKGVRFIPEVNDLESLILATEMVFMGGLDVNSEATKWVINRKGSEFKLANYGTWTEGALNFLSDVQALQIRG